jgi:general secretion pathway protein J
MGSEAGVGIIAARDGGAGQGGFTLLEMLLAILILGVVLTTVYASFTGTLRIVREAGDEDEAYAMARTVFDRVARDLAGLAPYKGDYEFTATQEEMGGGRFSRLSFRSRGHISFHAEDVPGTVAMIGYGVEEGTEENGYVLMRFDVPDRLSGDEWRDAFPLCRRIKALSFTFTGRDGREYETWEAGQDANDPKGRLPVSVLVNVEIVNDRDAEQPFRFMTRIFLPAGQEAS